MVLVSILCFVIHLWPLFLFGFTNFQDDTLLINTKIEAKPPSSLKSNNNNQNSKVYLHSHQSPYKILKNRRNMVKKRNFKKQTNKTREWYSKLFFVNIFLWKIKNKKRHNLFHSIDNKFSMTFYYFCWKKEEAERKTHGQNKVFFTCTMQSIPVSIKTQILSHQNETMLTIWI